VEHRHGLASLAVEHLEATLAASGRHLFVLATKRWAGRVIAVASGVIVE
jgi:hypothetical protein